LDGTVNVAGIDLSTHAVDVVKVPLDGDREPQWFRFPLIGSDAFDRARTVRDAMPCRSSEFWDDVMAIGIENPQARGPAAQNIAALHRVVGAVLACIPPHLLVHPLQPASWRKLVGLKGNATKWEVAGFSDDLRPRPSEDWPQDAHDAHLIARATRELITDQKEAAA
jgi:hypothetical protein